MLIHYLDYIKLLNKDLKRKGIYLFDIDKYELYSQVSVLEEFFYLNDLFKQSGGTNFVQSQYKYDAMSYLRDKISAEYSDTWNKEFEELTKQPENAGKIDCDVERIDDFIKKLGLKTRETVRPARDECTLFSQNNSAQATQYSFTYSAPSYDFGDSDDEEDEDFSEDDLDTDVDDFDDTESDEIDSEDLDITVLDFEENIPLEDLFPSGGIISNEDDLGSEDDGLEDFEDDLSTDEEDLDEYEDELDIDGNLDTEDEDDDFGLDVDYENADILDYSYMENDEVDEEEEDLDMDIQDDNPYGDFEDDEEEIDLDTENYDEDLEEYDEIEDDYDEEDDEELDLSAELEDDSDIDEEDEDEDLDLEMDEDFTDPEDNYSDDEDDDDYSISDYMYSDEPDKHSDTTKPKIPVKKQNVQRSNEKHADTLCRLVNKGVRFGSQKLNSKINGGK